MYKNASMRGKGKMKEERSVEDQETAFISNCSHMDVKENLEPTELTEWCFREREYGSSDVI